MAQHASILNQSWQKIREINLENLQNLGAVNISRIQVWWMKIAYICAMYCTSIVCIVTRRDVQFSDMIVLWQSEVNVLFIRPSDVTNSEHKLRQFSISLTFYFRILGSVIYLGREQE